VGGRDGARAKGGAGGVGAVVPGVGGRDGARARCEACWKEGSMSCPDFFSGRPDFGGPAERLLDIFDKLGMQQVALVQTNFDDQEFASRPGVKL
jgi:hypothetical protein